MALYSMHYTRRDNEALLIQAGKVSLRESLIHNKGSSILLFTMRNYEASKCQSYENDRAGLVAYGHNHYGSYRFQHFDFH
jgi:hypothetical protein